MQQSILYEFPLNERMRNFMRLESSFAQINYFSHHNTIWDSQACVLFLIDILNIIDRTDIHGEIAKELERNISSLTAFLNVPGINSQMLQQTLDELETQSYAMQQIGGKGSRSMREDELLTSIRQRLSVAANINSFDVPGFYYWLHKNAADRHLQLQDWLSELKPLESSINLLNRLLRDSATFTPLTAEKGFYQQALNPQQPCQMVRIALPADAKYFPETSGSKHRINIRFMCYETATQRPTQVTDNLEFSLSCCSI